MKSIAIVLVLWLLITQAKAQITLEHVIDPSEIGYQFYPVKISQNETKYYMLDTASNTFSLYNLDFTPFITGVGLPITIYPDYQVIYITRSLFHCDSTNIEFIVEAPNGAFTSFYIMRTDGAILFQADSAKGPYCIGCQGGSHDIRPIMNTEEGAKMLLMKYHAPGQQYIEIYSLCGSLPEGIFDFSSTEQSQVKIFPNPTTKSVTFEMELPSNMKNYKLTIIDAYGKELISRDVGFDTKTVSIDVNSLSSGLYYYSLTSESNKIETGKFSLVK